MTEKIKHLLEAYLRYLPSLIFFLVPLFFVNTSIDPFAINKFYLVNIFATTAVISWSIKNILENKITITLSPTTTGLFLLCLVHLISAYFMSPTKVLSLTGITTLFISLFLIHLSHTSVKQTSKSLEVTKNSLITSTIILSLITILHHFEVTKSILPISIFENKYANLTGSILSGLVFTLPIIFGLIIETTKTQENSKKITNILILSILATATTINLIYLFPKDPSLRPLNLLPLNTSWSIALDIFKYPGTAIIGTGPENYLSSFTRLRPAYLNLNNNLWNIRFSESSSLFLTILTTTGLIGGLSFLYIFLKNIKTKTSNENEFWIYTFIGFSLVSLLTPVGITGIITAIVLASVITQLQKNSEQKLTKTLHLKLSNEEAENPTSRFLPISMAILVCVTLGIYWNFGARFYLATIKIYQANKTINSDINESFQKQVEAQSLNPYDSTYSIILSKTYQQVALYYLQIQSPSETDRKNSIEMMQRSIDAARTAAQVDPFNVIVWENLSTVYQSFIGAADGATNLAISHLAQAISLDPTNPRLRLQMGILYYNLQDKEQAVKLINQASELKPNWSLPYQNLYRIYKEENDLNRAKRYLEEALKYETNNSDIFQKLQEELIDLNQKIK